MFRYVAMLWNVGCAQHCAQALALARRLQACGAEWRREFDGSGVAIWVADATRAMAAHRLHGGAGLVLGEIFVRQTDMTCDAPASGASFGEPESEEIRRSRGRCLTEKYWGNYVGLVVDEGAQRRFVVNDPCGALPCHFTEYCGVGVLFSCLADCLELLAKRFAINGSFLRGRTVNGVFDMETAAFAEISSVHRGECVSFDRAGRWVARDFYWHPERFADASQSIDDPELALRAVRATVRSCVHSLASHHVSVLQQTSGGLDSSIVLGCLAEAMGRPEVTCYTAYVPGAPGDERRWAGLAALGRSARHVAIGCDAQKLLLYDLPALMPSMDPPSSFTHWQRGPVERRLAAEYAASAVFTGEGGDATFCSTCYVLGVDHSLRRYGLGRRTWHTALQVAVRRDRTVWDILLKALRRRLFGTNVAEHRLLLGGMVQLVDDGVLETVHAQRGVGIPNPWFSTGEGMPIESLWRLGTLAFAPSFYDLSTSQHEFAPHEVSPLCAQPVFEVCRRIPVDIHFWHGRIRGLARRAFRTEVPEPILRRQWKDRSVSQPAKVVEGNLKFLRETLLDGELCREGILNRVAVELALANEVTMSRALSSEILKHLDLELWVRRLHGPPSPPF